MGSRSRPFDVAIVGGGVIGSSVAYHLARADPTVRIACVERDPTFARASSALSVGNARVQFSLEQNVRISQHALEAFERFGEEMAVDGVAPDIGFRREGNLFLVAEPEREAAGAAMTLQRGLGCAVEWLAPERIGERWPLLEVGRYAGGTWGPDDGHLDGWAMLMGYRRKAGALGAEMWNTEVESIVVDGGRATGLRLTGGERIEAGAVVCCAGAWCRELLLTCGVEVPVVPVQRQVFVVEPAIDPGGLLPLIGLPSGLYLRSEGERRLLVGRSLAEDPEGVAFAWSEARFEEGLWPELVELAPALDRLRLKRGWAGLYAVNRLDGNALLGEWPELPGLLLANGFSGHGLQQAPAVGRYLAELLLERRPVLDLSIFSPSRVLTGTAVSERALV
jgi:glycine/D-amino acid oxidase-like deaminating enzyme